MITTLYSWRQLNEGNRSIRGYTRAQGSSQSPIIVIKFGWRNLQVKHLVNSMILARAPCEHIHFSLQVFFIHASNSLHKQYDIFYPSLTYSILTYIFDIFYPSLGEECSHVVALFFKIEPFVCLSFTNSACTSKPCIWIRHFQRR